MLQLDAAHVAHLRRRLHGDQGKLTVLWVVLGCGVAGALLQGTAREAQSVLIGLP